MSCVWLLAISRPFRHVIGGESQPSKWSSGGGIPFDARVLGYPLNEPAGLVHKLPGKLVPDLNRSLVVRILTVVLDASKDLAHSGSISPRLTSSRPNMVTA